MFIIETLKGSILCETGEFLASRNVGPNAYTARTWKTRKGAEKFAAERWNQGGRTYVRVREAE